jgi:hypothetical protein
VSQSTNDNEQGLSVADLTSIRDGLCFCDGADAGGKAHGRARTAGPASWTRVMGRPVAPANLANRSRVCSLTLMVVLMTLVYRWSA